MATMKTGTPPRGSKLSDGERRAWEKFGGVYRERSKRRYWAWLVSVGSVSWFPWAVGWLAWEQSVSLHFLFTAVLLVKWGLERPQRVQLPLSIDTLIWKRKNGKLDDDRG